MTVLAIFSGAILIFIGLMACSDYNRALYKINDALEAIRDELRRRA